MDISSIKLNGTAYEVKDAQARQAIGNINAVLDQINGEVV